MDRLSADTRNVSWLALLLPHIGEQNLYARLDLNNALNPANIEVAAIPVAIYRCPSDPGDAVREDMMLAHTFPTGFPAAVSNYRGVAGSNWQTGPFARSEPTGRNAGQTNAFRHGNGIFTGGFLDPAFWAPPIVTRPSHISDGMSNTLAVGESSADWNAYSWWFWHNWPNGTTAIPLNYCAMVPDCFDDWPVNFGFHSRHSDGANFLKGDGSVQFVNQSIDMKAWFALATIDGGEVTPGF